MHIFNCASRHGAKTYGRIRETKREMNVPGCHVRKNETPKGKNTVLNIAVKSVFLSAPINKPQLYFVAWIGKARDVNTLSAYV